MAVENGQVHVDAALALGSCSRNTSTACANGKPTNKPGRTSDAVRYSHAVSLRTTRMSYMPDDSSQAGPAQSHRNSDGGACLSSRTTISLRLAWLTLASILAEYPVELDEEQYKDGEKSTSGGSRRRD